VLNESGTDGAVQLSLSSLLGVITPLLQQFILEGKAAEESGHDIKQVSHIAIWEAIILLPLYRDSCVG